MSLSAKRKESRNEPNQDDLWSRCARRGGRVMERGREIKVLDHGYVRLVDYMGSDEAVVEAARMSTGRGFVSWEPYRRCGIASQMLTLTEARRFTATVISDAGLHFLRVAARRIVPGRIEDARVGRERQRLAG
mgnify:CR=1 FL=1